MQQVVLVVRHGTSIYMQDFHVGVDIGRFSQDEEYKRETILGLTMLVLVFVFHQSLHAVI